jgi:hypothetical protein
MHVFTQVFTELKGNAGYLKTVVDGFTETVGGSFIADKSSMTNAEVARRTEMCAEFFMQFRKDLGWATNRILDELPKALRCKLDGIPYEPSRQDKQTWGADNGRDLIWLPPG